MLVTVCAVFGCIGQVRIWLAAFASLLFSTFLGLCLGLQVQSWFLTQRPMDALEHEVSRKHVSEAGDLWRKRAVKMAKNVFIEAC